jgi:hypothetical protein
MRNWNQKKIFFALLAAWFLINLLQAIFTEVFNDEAYYFMYGKYLAWGYFDHPPMIAIMVRISSLFFNGLLGVRIMTILMQLGTLYLTWKVLERKDTESNQPILFFIIAGSLWMFSAYGFISTPDAPLLFFTALFLFSYKTYLKDLSWKSVIILSISMAGLVYSKYQAVLVIGLVVLSNLRLLKMYKFWLAGIVAILLLSPHIYWQVANDFPSLKYHLVDRSDGFRWKYVFDYIPNQLVVFNPLIFGAVIYVLIKYRAQDLFTKALYFLIIGFVSFFGITTLRGHAEPQWTLACSIPMIILLFNRTSESDSLKKYVRKFIAPSLILLLLFRIFLVTNIPIVRNLELNGKAEKYEKIDSVANNLPVVFLSSYQSPSVYTFFTGKESFPISTLDNRQTQFDIWRLEKNFQHKPAFVADSREGRSQVFGKGLNSFTGYKTSSLQTTNRIKIAFELPVKSVSSGDTISVSFSITNPCDYDVDFNHFDFPVQVCAVMIKGKKTFINTVELSEPIDVLLKGETLKRTLKTAIPELPPDIYKFGISLKTALGTTINSTFDKISITKND